MDMDNDYLSGNIDSLTAVSMMEDDFLPSMEEMSTHVHSLILAGGASRNPLAVYRAVAAIPLGMRR
eukprot:scaffold29966_cov25-Prasinocladus_malaysianus.AAC.1